MDSTSGVPGAGNQRCFQRIASTSGTKMLHDMRDRASRAINPISEALTRTDIAVGIVPEYLIHNIELITSGLPGDDEERLLKRLLKLMIFDEAAHCTCMTLYCSMAILFNPALKPQLMSSFRTCKIVVTETNLTEFLNIHEELKAADVDDISMYAEAVAAHYIYAFALYSNMLGKQLGSNNYSFWVARRKQTYSAPLGLLPSDEMLDWLTMSRTVAERTNADLKMYTQIRRTLFLNIWVLSKSTDLLSRGLIITVNLLRYAELSNYFFISTWICILNADLFGWQELAKHLPFIEAAQDKYEAIGPLAPWCKLIFPTEELQEFQTVKLSTLFTVARGISIEYGSGSIENLQGELKNQKMRAILDHALYIVKVAGGAKTIDTVAVRAWKYNGFDNRSLYSALNKGAMVTDITEDQQEQEQRAV